MQVIWRSGLPRHYWPSRAAPGFFKVPFSWSSGAKRCVRMPAVGDFGDTSFQGIHNGREGGRLVEEGQGLSGTDGETPGRREHLFRGRRVRIRDLVEASLLEPGAVLVYERPQSGETLEVTVTETGQLQLPDGREIRSPSGAISQLCGKSVDGWHAWRTAADGQLLHGLRLRLIREAVREAPDTGDQDLEARQDEFLSSAKEAAESGSPRQMTVRELIGIWGARGRDFDVNERVDADLGNNGMTTTPDFRAVTLDDTVDIVLTTQVTDGEASLSATGTMSADATVSGPGELAGSDDESAWDHGLTIGNLPSASRKICAVAPDATFEEAITLMLTNDYSQLAVMTGLRDLKGAVSWKSIARARNANPGAKLSAAIIKASDVTYTADLIGFLPVIQSQEFVFVRGVDKTLTGIVTLADVVQVYGEMASPFFMIGRIDQSLRRIIEAAYPMSTITPLCDREGMRDLSTCDQLTMGDYQRILENPDCWTSLGWSLDRKTFCARLEEIVQVRNKLMHFNSDPLPDGVVSILQNFINLLKEYGI
jgi:CBS domain-containing protein